MSEKIERKLARVRAALATRELNHRDINAYSREMAFANDRFWSDSPSGDPLRYARRGDATQPGEIPLGDHPFRHLPLPRCPPIPRRAFARQMRIGYLNVDFCAWAGSNKCLRPNPPL